MNFSTLKKQSQKVTHFDFSQWRERDWQNILTTSEQGEAQMWSYYNHSISKVSPKHTLRKEVTCVAVT